MPKCTVEFIKVPADRQRKEFNNLEALADSIAEYGQIEPIIVDMQDNLIAGERRYRALCILDARAKVAGTKVPLVWYEYREPKSELHRHAMELEENIQREPLTKDEYASAVAEYHRIQQALHGKTIQRVAGGHGVRDTAEMLRISKSTVASMILIDRILLLRPELKGLPTFSAILSRFKYDKLREIQAEIARRVDEQNLKQDLVSCVHLVESSAFWLESLPAESVDLILTDVPFGIDVFDSTAFKSSEHATAWVDEPTKVRETVERSVEHFARIAKNHSHILIFCAWEQSWYIFDAAERTGLACDKPAWVWDRVSATPSASPTKASDKQYEMVCHLYKGSPIYPEAVGPNVLRFAKRTKTLYPTQKPEKLARYLVENFSLPGQLVLDPFFGSGEFLIAAASLDRRILGADCNPTALEVFKSRVVSEIKLEEAKSDVQIPESFDDAAEYFDGATEVDETVSAT